MEKNTETVLFQIQPCGRSALLMNNPWGFYLNERRSLIRLGILETNPIPLTPEDRLTVGERWTNSCRPMSNSARTGRGYTTTASKCMCQRWDGNVSKADRIHEVGGAGGAGTVGEKCNGWADTVDWDAGRYLKKETKG